MTEMVSCSESSISRKTSPVNPEAPFSNSANLLCQQTFSTYIQNSRIYTSHYSINPFVCEGGDEGTGYDAPPSSLPRGDGDLLLCEKLRLILSPQAL